MNKTLTFIVIGALAGLLVAEFFPSLGKHGLDAGLSDMAFSLGAKRPYLLDAGIGAAIGALIGLLQAKRK